MEYTDSYNTTSFTNYVAMELLKGIPVGVGASQPLMMNLHYKM